MAVNVTLNGVSYQIPQTGEEAWGDAVTGWIVSASSNLLQKTGGNFTLSADVNFGATAGPVAIYFKSRTVNIATAGQLRLANADSIQYRNFANSGNLPLAVNSSDQLTFNGVVLSTPTSTIARSQIAAGTAYRIVANTVSGSLGENAALTSGHVIIADSNGQLAGEATLAKVRGGTAQDNSSVTFPASGVIPTTSSTDTLSNKTLAQPIIIGFEDVQEVSTPATPSAGSLRVFATTGSQLAIKNSAGTTTILGSGSGSLAVTSKTANYTATPSDDLILCDATGGGFTITLPSAASNTGKAFRIRKTDTTFNAIAITGVSKNLDVQTEERLVVSDGTNWIQISHQLPIIASRATLITTPQTIPNATETAFNPNNEVFDTVGMTSVAGTYSTTCPKAGYYRIKAIGRFDTDSWSTNEVAYFATTLATPTSSFAFNQTENTASFAVPISGEVIQFKNKSDTILVYVFQNSTGGSQDLRADEGAGIEIEYLGETI